MERQTITTVLIALLVFVQPLSPLVGVAAAASSDECEGVEGGIYVVSLGHFEQECAVDNQVAGAVNDVKEAQDNQTETDIYAAAVAQNAGTDPFVSTYQNRITDSQTVAFTEAEISFAESYQNGTSLAVARQDARVAVEEYYSVQQRNLMAQWRAEVIAYQDLNKRAAIEGINAMPLGADDTTRVSYDRGEDGRMLFYALEGNANGEASTFEGVQNTTVTLANGSEVTIPALCFENPEDGQFCVYPGSNNHTQTYADLEGIAVSGGFDETVEDKLVIDFVTYEKSWDNTVQAQQASEEQVSDYANMTYEAFQQGKITPEDLISKVTAVQKYGTTDEGHDMYDIIAALSKMGVSAPDLNSTGMMTVQYDGEEYTGMVMAESAPGGGWETNTTYDASNITGPVWIASSDGESISMDGEFTISQIKSKSGETVKRVNTTKYVYKTSNTTEYAELLDKIEDLRQELENREPETGGGGDDDGGISIPELSQRQLIALVAVVLGLGALSAFGGRQ